jgi:hypothetical protein
MTTAIQFLRSSTENLRPDPSSLADGMPMLNTNEADPGLFFKARDGSLIKIGPCSVSSTVPNANAIGHLGNAKGEMWLDTSGNGSPRLKVYTGIRWETVTSSGGGGGGSGTGVIVSTVAPATREDGSTLESGDLWWDSSSSDGGDLYIYYVDADSSQWVSATAQTSVSTLSYTYPGGVEQSIQDRLERNVSVKDFGAVGDGIADDTAAFTAAAGQSVESIFVPSGSYALTSNIVGDFHAIKPVTIVGSGSVTSLKVLGETLVLTSPNGMQYAVSVADDGTLTTTAV